MGLRYLPMTEEDQTGYVGSDRRRIRQNLFSEIPEEVRFKGEYNLPPVKSEYELKKELTELANKKLKISKATSFLGAGVYQHYIPSVVNHVIRVQNFIRPIRLINQKFPKENYKRSLNSRR